MPQAVFGGGTSDKSARPHAPPAGSRSWLYPPPTPDREDSSVCCGTHTHAHVQYALVDLITVCIYQETPYRRKVPVVFYMSCVWLCSHCTSTSSSVNAALCSCGGQCCTIHITHTCIYVRTTIVQLNALLLVTAYIQFDAEFLHVLCLFNKAVILYFAVVHTATSAPFLHKLHSMWIEYPTRHCL